MKHLTLAAALCLGVAAFASSSQAAIALPVPPAAAAAAPQITPVWWAGPSTVCRRGYYGGVWCRPARPMGWVPGHYSWGGFWVPGHWS